MTLGTPLRTRPWNPSCQGHVQEFKLDHFWSGMFCAPTATVLWSEELCVPADDCGGGNAPAGPLLGTLLLPAGPCLTIGPNLQLQGVPQGPIHVLFSVGYKLLQ